MLRTLLVFGLLAVGGAAFAGVSPEVHEKCLKAADYTGCVSTQLRGAHSVDAGSEVCDDRGSCIANKGLDRLGLQKVEGWKYRTDAVGEVVYYEVLKPLEKRHGGFMSLYFLIPHKGERRYVGRRLINHWYDEGVAATPGYVRTTGGGSTTCNSYNFSSSTTTFCNTTPRTSLYIPGSPGRAAAARSSSWVQVTDCIDKTRAYYEDGKKLRGDWVPLGTEPLPWACEKLDTLQLLHLEL